MTGLNEIITQVKEGTLLPELAVDRAFESPATLVKDIELSADYEIVPSGFSTFDHYYLIKKGTSDLIILAARPSMGKSALAFQLAANVAEQGNVLIYSLEMDKESIVKRLVAGVAGRSLKKLKDVPADVLSKAKRKLGSLPLAIDDRSALDVATIKSSAESYHRKNPLSLVVVDYLGLVRSRELGNRNNEIGEVTSGLKALAKSLKCPVMLLSQLNREVDRRGKDARSGSFGDFRPILSDLRDSGNIEQDADLVVFLSRQQVYDGTRPGDADIRIAKNRNGEVGDFVLKFSGEQTRFYEPREADSI